MPSRLNHENLSFKLGFDNYRQAGSNDYYPQSIQELQNEIDECELCQKLKPEYCIWHEEKIDGGEEHLTNSY